MTELLIIGLLLILAAWSISLYLSVKSNGSAANPAMILTFFAGTLVLSIDSYLASAWFILLIEAATIVLILLNLFYIFKTKLK